MNRSPSALAEPPALPWLYPYRDDPRSTRLGQPVFRAFVPVSFATVNADLPVTFFGLVDTGADAILASDIVADRLGLDLTDHEGETTHAVGGQRVVARSEAVAVRLHQQEDNFEDIRAWEAPVGFIEGWHNPSLVLLGSIGFLDQWTATASRHAQTVAIEHRDAFDARFGIALTPSG